MICFSLIVDIEADLRYYYFYLYQKKFFYLVSLYQCFPRKYPILSMLELHRGLNKFVLYFEPLNLTIMIYYITRNKVINYSQLVLFQV